MWFLSNWMMELNWMMEIECGSFQIEFLSNWLKYWKFFHLILNKAYFCLFHNQEENCQYDNIPLNLKGIINRFLCVFALLFEQTGSWRTARTAINYLEISTIYRHHSHVAHTDKTIFAFPFKLNWIWSSWQFSFRFWTK